MWAYTIISHYPNCILYGFYRLLLVFFHHKSAVNVFIYIFFITIYENYCNIYYLPSEGLTEAIFCMTRKISNALQTGSYVIVTFCDYVHRQSHNKYF